MIVKTEGYDLDRTTLEPTSRPSIFTKREKPVFLSVKVGGNPTRKEAEDIAGIWETGLWNNHVHADRFMLGDDTAAYLFKVRINF